MTYSMRTNFQRSQSKVWFGNNASPSSYYSAFHSLPAIIDSQSDKFSIQEQNELKNSPEEILNVSSKLNISVWSNHGSPSSHKSQDSGFSDAETSKNSTNSSQVTPNMKSDSILKGSPSDSDTSTIATPPTVVRRYVKPIYEEIRSSRRISFSAPSSPNSPDISQQLDGINFNTTSPMVSNENLTLSPNASLRGLKNRLLKRSRVITKSSNRVILHDSGDSNLNVNNLQDEISSSYHNETIYLGRCEIVSNLFESENASHQSPNAPLYMELIHPASTSTPKKFVTINDSSSPIISSSIIICDNSTSYEDQAAYDKVLNELRLFVPKSYCYLNPLLNGNMESVQAWLDSVNKACQSEVMSTLQNKSVSAEAKRNSALNSTTTVQIIKWLQKNVFPLQVEFEKIERLFDSQSERNFSEISPLILNLSALILDFIIKLESHKNFYSKDSIILSKFLGHIRSIREVTIDLKILTMKIDAEYMEDLLNSSIEEDVGILKRYFLVTSRLIFEQLIRIIVKNIEETTSELILNANLIHVAQLSNFEYTGFASLNDAFVANGTVRVLLLVCIESKETKTRALALRALSTICSSTETIHQLEKEGGIEILQDILKLDLNTYFERSEQELREAVSVLTQVTAPWQTSPKQLDGLKEFSERIIESILDLVTKTNCCQTILLCSACLNNISRLEPTSVYSLMSHDCINKFKLACDGRGPMASIFIYEQITSMILNMSTNKKSHHYLADKHIISFIIASFQMKFSQNYSSLAENTALKRTLQNIMQILTRLIDESIVSLEVLNSNVLPVFSKIERQLKNDSVFYNNISMINKKLNESNFCNKIHTAYNTHGISIDRNRQQSFV